MANNIEKKIQNPKIISNFIIINDNNFDTILNSRLMNGPMNIKISPNANSFRTPSDSEINDEFFSIIINNAINIVYTKNKRS